MSWHFNVSDGTADVYDTQGDLVAQGVPVDYWGEAGPAAAQRALLEHALAEGKTGRMDYALDQLIAVVSGDVEEGIP